MYWSHNTGGLLESLWSKVHLHFDGLQRKLVRMINTKRSCARLILFFI